MIGAVGGIASDIWQALRQARLDPKTTAPGTPSAAGPATATTASTSAEGALTTSNATSTAAPPAPPSDAASQLITDINSLLLSLQGGAPSSTSTSAAATSPNATTSAAAAVQSDLNTLASAQSNGGTPAKVGGHGHHHRSPQATDFDATSSGTNTASATGASSADTTLIDSIAKAIKAYAASNSNTPSSAASLLSA